MSEDCDFWWFQLEKELEEVEDGTASRKYVISVDFGTTSKVHLNPLYFGKMWCRLNEEKRVIDGGMAYVTAEEARKYLDGRETLLFKGRAVENLAKCVNCSNRSKQSVHWDL